MPRFRTRKRRKKRIAKKTRLAKNSGKLHSAILIAGILEKQDTDSDIPDTDSDIREGSAGIPVDMPDTDSDLPFGEYRGEIPEPEVRYTDPRAEIVSPKNSRTMRSPLGKKLRRLWSKTYNTKIASQHCHFHPSGQPIHASRIDVE